MWARILINLVITLLWFQLGEDGGRQRGTAGPDKINSVMKMNRSKCNKILLELKIAIGFEEKE